MVSPSPSFRPATSRDIDAVLPLMAAYYAEDNYSFDEDKARAQLHRFIQRPDFGALFVAVVDDVVAGYLVVTLGFSFEYGGRDAFIDELYIATPFRGAGLGRVAMQCADAYCGRLAVRAIHLEVERQRKTAAQLYEKAGFRETDRRLMTKRLAEDTTSPSTSEGSLYGPQLARVHHDHFTRLAHEAAVHLIQLLESVERAQGDGDHDGDERIVELACGGGVSSKILADAGYDVVGVDLSASMLDLARAHAPNATFVESSLWDYELPPARAITAIGEAFCYQGPAIGSTTRSTTESTSGPAAAPTHERLEARLRQIFNALGRGGVLLFDVATPGRSGPTGRRRGAWDVDGTFVYLDETQDAETNSLERIIDTFVPAGAMHEHHRERHRLTLFDASRVAESLERIGFRWRQLAGLGRFEFLSGWVAFEAVKP